VPDVAVRGDRGCHRPEARDEAPVTPRLLPQVPAPRGELAVDTHI